MSIQEYYDALEAHDWYYSFSDDMRKYKQGELARFSLETIAKQSPEHQKLYNAFEDHMFSGALFGTVKKVKPERPVIKD